MYPADAFANFLGFSRAVIWCLVAWWLGALMAVGQSLGAWLAARFAVGNPSANIWVRRLLIAVIVFSILKLFGAFDLLLG